MVISYIVFSFLLCFNLIIYLNIIFFVGMQATYKRCLLVCPLTPNFQPAIGMIATTETVIQQIVNVAMRPIMMLCVASTRMGNAKAKPQTIPITADDTKIWKPKQMVL